MDMVNGLNRMDDLQPFSPGAFLLAVKMIDLMNGLYWPDAVAIDTNRMGVLAKCASRNATLNARNELIARGVLSVVTKGRKGSPSVYRLADLSQFGTRRKPHPGGMRDGFGNESGTLGEPHQGPLDRPEENMTKTRRNQGESRASRFTPPSPEEVSAYVRETGAQVDPERFCDFYASKGWKVGNAPMRDWRAAVRIWAKREDRGQPPPSPASGASSPPEKVVGHQQYPQRSYTNNYDAVDEMMKRFLGEG